MEGITIKDVTPVRVPFGEMPAMLARGDLDAYVGAEPGPGAFDHLGRRPARRVSLRHRDGRPEHDLRHARGHRRPRTPTWCSTMLKLQRQAAEFMMAQQARRGRHDGAEARRQPCRGRAGARRQQRRVHLEARRHGAWARPRPTPQHMLELKQIRALPKFETFLNPNSPTSSRGRATKDRSDEQALRQDLRFAQ